MAWKETTKMSLRIEFISLARCGGVPFAELCRRHGISRKTGYKWLARAEEYDLQEGVREETLNQKSAGWSQDRSRRPLSSPIKTSEQVEQEILAVRYDHPAWGGRKIARFLEDQGVSNLPSPSTITAILRRHGLLAEASHRGAAPTIRFEREKPNALWQMDFKGHFALEDGSRCHPLVVVDDCSRYLIALEAHPWEREDVVRATLTKAFRTHGLPLEMLMDNGSVWGNRSTPTRLCAWLMRLKIAISHGRPYHPQTQGKCERLNRSLKAEALPEGRRFEDLTACQKVLDRFRRCYNYERPHEALNMDSPSKHYQPGEVAFPESLPAIEYEPNDIVRRVTTGGSASLRSQFYLLGRAFANEPIAFRPTTEDGVYDVYYCHTFLRRIDERNPDYQKYERKKPIGRKNPVTAGDKKDPETLDTKKAHL